TFSDLQELEDAIEAARRVAGLPIIALLSFDERAETVAGVTAGEAATRLTSLGVAAVGANHGAGLLAAPAALDQMPACRLPPPAAPPNLPPTPLAGDRIVSPPPRPAFFGESAPPARAPGAMVIGGCCGTPPAEIAAIASVIADERRPRAPLVFSERALVVSLG